MGRQSDVPYVLQIGITNDILTPAPGGEPTAPAVLSAQDAAILVNSLQRLLYLTVAGQAGKNERNLTDPERAQYEIVLDRVDFGSVKFKFKSKLSGSAHEVDEAAQLTFEWVNSVTVKVDSSFGDKLANSNDISKLQLASDILETVALAIPVGMHPHDPALWAVVALDLLAKICRVSAGNNRFVEIQQGQQDPYKPSPRQVHSLVEADKVVTEYRPGRATEEKQITWGPGEIVNVDHDQPALYIRFPHDFRNPEPIRCLYDRSLEYDTADGRHLPFQAGQWITVFGKAVYAKKQWKDSPPQFIDIERVSR